MKKLTTVSKNIQQHIMPKIKTEVSLYFGPTTRSRKPLEHITAPAKNVVQIKKEFKEISKKKHKEEIEPARLEKKFIKPVQLVKTEYVESQTVSSKLHSNIVKNANTSHCAKLNIKWEPKNWKQQFENIQEMRKEKDAPVDTMGCERCTKPNYTEKEKRYHILVSLMLSSQTKDQVTYAAMERLHKHGLTIDNIVKISDEQLGKLIFPVGFWKKKVDYLKRTATILRDQYVDDIPSDVDSLVKLPGVGPKMAYLVMNCAWDQVVGIGVDVHVHRIANRLGWVKKTTKNPEDTRKELEDWLPQEMWKETNWLLVGFGQHVCLKASPKCLHCLNKHICPASQA